MTTRWKRHYGRAVRRRGRLGAALWAHGRLLRLLGQAGTTSAQAIRAMEASLFGPRPPYRHPRPVLHKGKAPRR